MYQKHRDTDRTRRTWRPRVFVNVNAAANRAILCIDMVTVVWCVTVNNRQFRMHEPACQPVPCRLVADWCDHKPPGSERRHRRAVDKCACALTLPRYSFSNLPLVAGKP